MELDDHCDGSKNNNNNLKKISQSFLIWSEISNVLTGSTSESVSSDRNEEPVQKKHRSNKNPDVDTSFLPDRDREEEENKLREELRQVLHHWSIILLVIWLN